MSFTRLPPDEIERRRQASIKALDARDRAAFDRQYQEWCDTEYWRRGPCCAGCDHWRSDGGKSGECTAAGIVSGADVLRSMGISFSSYMPAPGHPYTQHHHHCGKFRDAFDWSTLDELYLTRIGAMKNGTLRPKLEAKP